MAKGTAPKGAKSVPNKHLHSRISYLYQAANYLSSQDLPRPADHNDVSQEQVPSTGRAQDAVNEDSRTGGSHAAQRTELDTNSFPPGLPFYYVSHLQSVSLKSQIRLSQDVKHSICKRCNAILIPGSTSSSRIENKSRGGKKPWADVLVIECNVCCAQKRFPVGAKRQPRKGERVKAEQKTTAVANPKDSSNLKGEDSETSNAPLIEGIGIESST